MIELPYAVVLGLAALLSVRYIFLLRFRYIWQNMCAQYAHDSRASTEQELDEIAVFITMTPMTHMLLEFWSWDFKKYISARALSKMLDFYKSGASLGRNGSN